tara:strand:- start:28969 stop:29412 length:444 start_codon:yes stop_codon:yes gene_type:complete
MRRETRGDRKAQTAAGDACRAAWGWAGGEYANKWSPIDYYFTDGIPLVCVGEFKRRNNPHRQYKTVFLSVRKYEALERARVAAGVDARYVVGYDDGIWWVDSFNVDASNPQILGRTDRANAPNDQEPVIEVPVASMTFLTKIDWPIA